MNVPRISANDLTSGFPELWNELAEDVEQHHLAIDANAAAARSMFNDTNKRIDGLNLTLHRAVDRLDLDIDTANFAHRLWLAAVSFVATIGLFT